MFYMPALGDVAFVSTLDGSYERLPGDGHYGPVSWSTDGSRLCYHTVSDSLDAKPGSGRVIVYNVDDNTAAELTLPIGLDEAMPVFHETEHGSVVRLYATDAVFEAPVHHEGSFVRLEMAMPVGGGPLSVTAQGLMAWVNGEQVVLSDGLNSVRSLSLAGVIELAFDPGGRYLAAIQRVSETWRLLLAPVDGQSEPIELDAGSGEARGLSWSAEARYVACIAPEPDGMSLRVIDVVSGSIEVYQAPAMSEPSWIDPATVLVLIPAGDMTRAVMIGVE